MLTLMFVFEPLHEIVRSHCQRCNAELDYNWLLKDSTPNSMRVGLYLNDTKVGASTLNQIANGEEQTYYCERCWQEIQGKDQEGGSKVMRWQQSTLDKFLRLKIRRTL